MNLSGFRRSYDFVIFLVLYVGVVSASHVICVHIMNLGIKALFRN